MSNENKEHEKDKKFGDILKKVVSTGISAAFMTEDAVKTLVQDLPIPKEFVNSLLQNAKQTKEDIVHNIKGEFNSYLSKIDLSREIDRILETYDVEVKLSFKRKKPKDKSD